MAAPEPNREKVVFQASVLDVCWSRALLDDSSTTPPFRAPAASAPGCGTLQLVRRRSPQPPLARLVLSQHPLDYSHIETMTGGVSDRDREASSASAFACLMRPETPDAPPFGIIRVADGARLESFLRGSSASLSVEETPLLNDLVSPTPSSSALELSEEAAFEAARLDEVIQAMVVAEVDRRMAGFSPRPPPQPPWWRSLSRAIAQALLRLLDSQAALLLLGAVRELIDRLRVALEQAAR